MKIIIKYDEKAEKVLISENGKEFKEIEFSLLLDLTTRIIENNLSFQVETEGFEKAPDVGNNYKKMIEDIILLKDDAEIKDLKTKIDKKEEQDNNMVKSEGNEEVYEENDELGIEGI